MAVGDDDVIHEEDAHQFTGMLDAFGQFVVGFAGSEVTGRVVVANGEDSGVGKDGLADDDADIDGCLRDATVRDTYFLDETVVLVEQQRPELFHVEVLHLRVHLVINLGSRIQFRPFFGRLLLTALAQFTGGEDGDGFGLANAVINAEIVDRQLSEGVEVVVAVVEYPFHQIDGTLLRGAGTDEDGQQLGIAQCFRTECYHLFTWAVFFCPLGNVEFFHIDLRFEGLNYL